MTASTASTGSGGSGSSAVAVASRVSAHTGRPLAEPDERGRLVIDNRVVAKIAAQAASEVDDASGLRRRIVGRGLGRPKIRARADVDGSVTTLTVELAVDYPAPVLRVTRAVRRHVSDVVSDLAGVTVDHVDIAVNVLRRRPLDDTPRVV